MDRVRKAKNRVRKGIIGQVSNNEVDGGHRLCWGNAAELSRSGPHSPSDPPEASSIQSMTAVAAQALFAKLYSASICGWRRGSRHSAVACLRDLARGICRIQGIVREHGGARRAFARTDVGTARLSVLDEERMLILLKEFGLVRATAAFDSPRENFEALMRSPIDAAKRRPKNRR